MSDAELMNGMGRVLGILAGVLGLITLLMFFDMIRQVLNSFAKFSAETKAEEPEVKVLPPAPLPVLLSEQKPRKELLLDTTVGALWNDDDIRISISVVLLIDESAEEYCSRITKEFGVRAETAIHSWIHNGFYGRSYVAVFADSYYKLVDELKCLHSPFFQVKDAVIRDVSKVEEPVATKVLPAPKPEPAPEPIAALVEPEDPKEKIGREITGVGEVCEYLLQVQEEFLKTHPTIANDPRYSQRIKNRFERAMLALLDPVKKQ